MDLQELISPENIITSLECGSKKQLLQEVAKLSAERCSLDPRQVFDVLLERERLGSTGVGNGIAIPHGKIAELDSIYGMFVRLSAPLDFESNDEQPVDIVFLLLAPEGAGAEHLKALSRVSRLFRDGECVDKLRDASDASSIYTLLGEQPKSNAA